ncbi:MAG: FlgD immunoglobulin-like domain containing protein, partial [Saprospiraceae bacterium]|nr:FlgD immunoglobulin-like domain containing protein [Saprospiraceae bacterium]
ATTISFAVTGSSEVCISISDLSGRPVRGLFCDAVSPGESRSVSWDGTDDAGAGLPAGVYCVRLQTSTAVHVLKTIIVR